MEQALKGGKRKFFPVRLERFTQQQVAGAVVGNRQRITIPSIAELKLALESIRRRACDLYEQRGGRWP